MSSLPYTCEVNAYRAFAYKKPTDREKCAVCKKRNEELCLTCEVRQMSYPAVLSAGTGTGGTVTVGGGGRVGLGSDTTDKALMNERLGCPYAVGACNHVFHVHCVERANISDRAKCLLCQQPWHIKEICRNRGDRDKTGAT